MNIDEFIEHVQESARKHRYHADFFDINNPMRVACIKSAEDCEQLAEWLEKFKEYQQLEEQGRLVKLPCKEVFCSSGDEVYYIFDNEIVECIHCGLFVDFEGKLWISLACNEDIFPYRSPDAEHDLDPTDWCKNTTEVLVNEFGKTVFLTKSEGEAKLKELRGGENESSN